MGTESGLVRQDGQGSHSVTKKMSETDGLRFPNPVIPSGGYSLCSGLATDLWCCLGKFFCFSPLISSFHYSLLFRFFHYVSDV